MTLSTVEPTTLPTTRAGDLLLARLLPPTKRPPAPKKVRDDIAKFFRERLSDDRWQETVDGLVGSGLLVAKPLRLTESGRARAFEFLDVSELPPNSTWATIQSQLLVPKALGLEPGAEALRKLNRTDALAALLIKRRRQLPDEVKPTLAGVLDALICRKLGLPETTPFKEVRALLAARELGSNERLNAKELNKQALLVLLGANGVAGLREAALQDWADGAAPRPAPIAPHESRDVSPLMEEPAMEFDLSAFAETVKAAARDCPTGRFGDNKVFISHVWRRLRDEPSFPAMDLPVFKQRLTEANNARLLTLSRADLVEVMDVADVKESEAHYLNAEFHFVLVEKEQP